MFSMFQAEKEEVPCFRGEGFFTLVGKSLASKRMPRKSTDIVTIKYISTSKSKQTEVFLSQN